MADDKGMVTVKLTPLERVTLLNSAVMQREDKRAIMRMQKMLRDELQFTEEEEAEYAQKGNPDALDIAKLVKVKDGEEYILNGLVVDYVATRLRKLDDDGQFSEAMLPLWDIFVDRPTTDEE